MCVEFSFFLFFRPEDSVLDTFLLSIVYIFHQPLFIFVILCLYLANTKLAEDPPMSSQSAPHFSSYSNMKAADSTNNNNNNNNSTEKDAAAVNGEGVNVKASTTGGTPPVTGMYISVCMLMQIAV